VKKLIAFFLSASMLFTFASCTEKETDSKGNLTSVSEGQKNSGYTYKGDTFTTASGVIRKMMKAVNVPLNTKKR